MAEPLTSGMTSVDGKAKRMETRRDFLKMAALLAGGAAAAGAVPDAVQRAYAIAPEPGTTWSNAEHVVLLMQENRSFDHMLGTLRGVRGFSDPRAFRLPDGDSVFAQKDAAGNCYAPWRLDIRDTRVTWMGSLPHSRQSQVDAWNGGRHDAWLEAKRSGRKEFAELPLTMGYYTREDLPFYYALADAFTVCDQNYCSVMTSTSPNRCYFWSGTIREEQKAGSAVHVRNDVIDDGGLRWTTYPERLHEAGVSWKVYQNELTNAGLAQEPERWLANYGDNTLECFEAFHVAAHDGAAETYRKRMKELARDEGKLLTALAAARDARARLDLEGQIKLVRWKIANVQRWLADEGRSKYDKLSPHEKALHDAAFCTNAGDDDYRELNELPYEDNGKPHVMKVPKGDVFYQFRKDVDEGKLPMVSWLVAPENFSDHPSAPWYGAWYVSEAMNILTKNPEVWKKTIFILTYDENDGYFDHGVSYVAADPARPETGGASAGIDTAVEYVQPDEETRLGIAQKDVRQAPIGMGFRVPMIVASPWSRGGWVNSQLFDHTSTLMFLEKFIEAKTGKRVREENISAWRRAVGGDMTSVFRTFGPAEEKLPFLDRDAAVTAIERAQFRDLPSNYKKLDRSAVALINRRAGSSALGTKQERGTKASCALPYELYADGRVSGDGKSFTLHLRCGTEVHGARSAGAPFNVYLRGLKDAPHGFRAATYAVSAGGGVTLRYELSRFNDGDFCIEVHAPNGFYRMYRGDTAALPVTALLEYDSRGRALTGDVLLRLENAGAKPVRVSVEDGSYQAPKQEKALSPGEKSTVRLGLRQNHDWYDVIVKTLRGGTEVRLAGRVETGASSATDPAMA